MHFFVKVPHPGNRCNLIFFELFSAQTDRLHKCLCPRFYFWSNNCCSTSMSSISKNTNSNAVAIVYCLTGTNQGIRQKPPQNPTETKPQHPCGLTVNYSAKNSLECSITAKEVCNPHLFQKNKNISPRSILYRKHFIKSVMKFVLQKRICFMKP